jgi:UDPglucose 6-dehydrogenase
MTPHSPNNHEPRPCWPAGRQTKIGVIGAGEIGLRTAIEFAERGHHVVCAAEDPERAMTAGLAERARHSARTGRLRFTSSSADVARHGQVIVMADVTHWKESALFETAVEVAQNLTGPTIIVDRSTASAALADQVAQLLVCNSEHEIVVVSEPQSGRRALRVVFGPTA